MKRTFKTIIIALALGAITVNANTAFASNGSPLKGGIEFKDEFANFINKKGAKFSKKNIESFNKYSEVVNLYYTSNVAFFNMSETEKTEFIAASENLMKSLKDIKNEDAQDWANKVNLNKNVFEFIWSSKNLAAQTETQFGN